MIAESDDTQRVLAPTRETDWRLDCCTQPSKFLLSPVGLPFPMLVLLKTLWATDLTFRPVVPNGSSTKRSGPYDSSHVSTLTDDADSSQSTGKVALTPTDIFSATKTMSPHLTGSDLSPCGGNSALGTSGPSSDGLPEQKIFPGIVHETVLRGSKLVQAPGDEKL